MDVGAAHMRPPTIDEVGDLSDLLNVRVSARSERLLANALSTRFASGADDAQNGERRSWRRFVHKVLSDKTKVLLHHRGDGCRR